MGFFPKGLADWFRGALRGGLNAALAREAAEIKIDLLDTNAKVFQKAIEVRRYAKQIAETGDDFDRELAAALDTSLRETIDIGKSLLTPMTHEERAEVLGHHPLPESGGSPTSLPPAANPSALMAPESTAPEANGTTQEPPVRRGPGRPKGAKNRPKDPSPNGNGHE